MAKASIIPQLETSDRVREVAVPPEARALSTLERVDYGHAFLVDIASAQERTAEEWARAVVEDAPAVVRSMLRSGWTAIGLKLGSAPSDRSVLGWEIRRGTPEQVILGSDAGSPMSGELLFKRLQHTLLFCTFVQHDNDTARDLWARIEPTHVRIVRYLLDRAARETGSTPRPGRESGRRSRNHADV